MEVLIADDRTDWMREEDEVMACLTRCSSFKRCSTRIGTQCKRLGGTEIPKIRGGTNGKEKSRYRKSAARRL